MNKMRPKDQTKELIARTALGLFVEKGIDGATIRDIAAAAGIAEGTLYRHYPGKDALAWDLFSRNFTAFALELHRIQAGQSTLRAKLDAMVRQFCAFFDHDPVLFSYLLLAQHGQLGNRVGNKKRGVKPISITTLIYYVNCFILPKYSLGYQPAGI